MGFSAVLLAGGKSSRMGRDKAALVVDGQPLWLRQIEKLRATGAAEVFISGKADGPYAGRGVEVLEDEFRWRHAGPLGGIGTSLRRCASEWLLVLAVDMPAMTVEFLRNLAEQAVSSGKTMVPRDGRGRWEPLAAVYPKAGYAMAEARLLKGELRMDEWVEEMMALGMLEAREILRAERGLFVNWNEPGDVEGRTPNTQ